MLRVDGLRPILPAGRQPHESHTAEQRPRHLGGHRITRRVPSHHSVPAYLWTLDYEWPIEVV